MTCEMLEKTFEKLDLKFIFPQIEPNPHKPPWRHVMVAKKAIEIFAFLKVSQPWMFTSSIVYIFSNTCKSVSPPSTTRVQDTGLAIGGSAAQRPYDSLC